MQKHVPPLTDWHFRGYAPESLPPSHKATARQAAFAWDDGCNRTQVNNSVLQVQHSIINSPTEYRFSIKLSCRQGLAPGSLDFALGMTDLMDRAILRRDGRGSAQTATNRL